MPDDTDVTGFSPEGDAALMTELGEVLREVHPVPADFARVGVESFTWRDVDAELAELTFDSLATSGGTLVRSMGHEPRILVFEAPSVSVEIELTRGAEGCRLVGQVSPPAPATVEVRHPGGTARVQADDFGRFRVSYLAAGPMSLRCELPPGDGGMSRAVETSWLVA